MLILATYLGLHYLFRDRKRRVTSLSMLRKRFGLRRRNSKLSDYSKDIRDLIAGWSPTEVHALWEEYEASIALKDLTVQVKTSSYFN